jgi:hypothetical protein
MRTSAEISAFQHTAVAAAAGAPSIADVAEHRTACNWAVLFGA